MKGDQNIIIIIQNTVHVHTKLIPIIKGWPYYHKGASNFPYHFLNPNNVRIWVGGSRKSDRSDFGQKEKQYALILKKNEDKKRFVLFCFVSNDFC